MCVFSFGVGKEEEEEEEGGGGRERLEEDICIVPMYARVQSAKGEKASGGRGLGWILCGLFGSLDEE